MTIKAAKQTLIEVLKSHLPEVTLQIHYTSDQLK